MQNHSSVGQYSPGKQVRKHESRRWHRRLSYLSWNVSSLNSQRLFHQATPEECARQASHSRYRRPCSWLGHRSEPFDVVNDTGVGGDGQNIATQWVDGHATNIVQAHEQLLTARHRIIVPVHRVSVNLSLWP